mmetsp:Transcript_7279/g.19057  ORF Transcript_7279/g.19057 Transcript_7279/m.19057 type:complete len:506 (-) Transcript_7279:248-1765(-)
MSDVAVMRVLESMPGKGCREHGDASAVDETLRRCALPGFVLVDFFSHDGSPDHSTAHTLLEAAPFSASCLGGSLLTVGVGEASEHDLKANACGWLCVRQLTAEATPTIVLDAILDIWPGWLPALQGPPPEDASCLTSCLTCGDEPEQLLVCSGCHSVAFCDGHCQLAEQLRAGGACPHIACCAALLRHRARWGTGLEAGNDASVQWRVACNGPLARSCRTMCELLNGAGLHHPSQGFYALCGCSGAGPAKALAAGRVGEAGGVMSARPGLLTLVGWEEAYARLGLPRDSAAALVLDFPLTLYATLSQTLANATLTAQPWEVHVLGASEECEVRLLESYACLATLLPDGCQLQVRMFGPQLSASSTSPPLSVEYTDMARDVSVKIVFNLGLYHVEARTQPLLALAHNAGLAEYESWRPTVCQLVLQRTPLYFTSYAEVEVDAACAKMREWLHPLKQPLVVRTDLNQFRQPLDRVGVVSGGCVAVPWVSNGWLTRVTAGECVASDVA